MSLSSKRTQSHRRLDLLGQGALCTRKALETAYQRLHGDALDGVLGESLLSTLEHFLLDDVPF